MSSAWPVPPWSCRAAGVCRRGQGSVGDRVFVCAGGIEGEAPALAVEVIEV